MAVPKTLADLCTEFRKKNIVIEERTEPNLIVGEQPVPITQFVAEYLGCFSDILVLLIARNKPEVSSVGMEHKFHNIDAALKSSPFTIDKNYFTSVAEKIFPYFSSKASWSKADIEKLLADGLRVVFDDIYFNLGFKIACAEIATCQFQYK